MIQEAELQRCLDILLRDSAFFFNFFLCNFSCFYKKKIAKTYLVLIKEKKSIPSQSDLILNDKNKSFKNNVEGILLVGLTAFFFSLFSFLSQFYTSECLQ